MTSVKVEWKDFNVNLQMVEAYLKTEYADSNYCGNLAYSEGLVFYFNTTELSEDVIDSVKSYWDSLSPESEESVNYKEKAQIALELKTKKSSGKTKLKALGLSDDEIEALLG